MTSTPPIDHVPSTTESRELSKHNADGSLEGIIGTIYFRMNAGNVLKNTIGAGACIATLTGSAKIATGMTLPITGLTTLIGLFYIGTGVSGIKEAIDSEANATTSRKIAEKELKELKTPEAAAKSTRTALTQTEKTKQVALFKIKEYMARLGICGWSLYIGIGIAQLGAGIVTMLGPDTAQALHTTAILTGHVVKSLLTGLLTGLGVAYIARGFVMLYRSHHGIQHSINLRKGLEDIVNTNDFDNATLENQKKAIIHFLEINCALNEDQTKDIYTNLDKYKFDRITTAELYQYIQALDEGFNDEISRQQVARTIGASMVLGGALTLVAAYLSGGTSVVLVSLVSSIIFTVMEGSFLLYDSTPHFESYVHKNYKQPKYLQNKSATISTIYGIDTDRFKQYQSDLYLIKPKTSKSNIDWRSSNSENSALLPKSPVFEKPKLTWLELAWSPLYPLTLYKKYEEKCKSS